jgi:hypothetical protein
VVKRSVMILWVVSPNGLVGGYRRFEKNTVLILIIRSRRQREPGRIVDETRNHLRESERHFILGGGRWGGGEKVHLVRRYPGKPARPSGKDGM